MTRPFVKWAGGKYRLADKLIPFILKDFNPSKNRYFEPMVGSGGFFFRYAPKNAYLSDVNSKLIDTYKSLVPSLGTPVKQILPSSIEIDLT